LRKSGRKPELLTDINTGPMAALSLPAGGGDDL
jgi:hypothetical protein